MTESEQLFFTLWIMSSVAIIVIAIMGVVK